VHYIVQYRYDSTHGGRKSQQIEAVFWVGLRCTGILILNASRVVLLEPRLSVCAVEDMRIDEHQKLRSPFDGEESHQMQSLSLSFICHPSHCYISSIWSRSPFLDNAMLVVSSRTTRLPYCSPGSQSKNFCRYGR
jgi:hypothetical protein